MVVIEAGILGLAGSLIGAAVGLVVGGLLVAWSSGGFGLAFDPPWASIALAVLFGLLISVTASIYPAGWPADSRSCGPSSTTRAGCPCAAWPLGLVHSGPRTGKKSPKIGRVATTGKTQECSRPRR